MAAQPPRQPETMRDRLLQAGRKALLEDGLQIMKRGLTIPMIVDRVPTSDTTFGKQFPGNGATGIEGGKDKFVEELMSSLVTDNPRATQALLVEELSEKLVESNGDPRIAIRELCKWDFEQVRSDPATLIRLFITVIGRNHDGALKAVRAEYKQITEYGMQAYEQILSRWGATLRKPFTTESVAVLFTGIVEGLVLRWLLDPKAVPDTLFGEAIIAFTASVVDTEQRQEHIDDAIAPLANEVMREFQLSQNDELADDPYGDIIKAARTEFSQRGYFGTDITQIASTAGVNRETLKRLFPNKADIVVASLKPAFDELATKVANDIKLGRRPVDTLKRFLEKFASLTMDDRTMFDALLMLTAHDTTQGPETSKRIHEELDVPGLIIPVIEAGQDSRLFSTTLPAPEIAATLCNTLLLTCFTRKGKLATEVATTVSELFLNGILVGA